MAMPHAMDLARTAAEKQITLSIICCTSVLMRGRALVEYQQRGDEHRIAQNQHYAEHHWSETSAWQFSSAIDQTVVHAMKDIISKSEFLALSCDETTDRGKTSQMCIHIYAVSGWKRKSLLISLAPTPLPANAANLSSHMVSSLCHFTGLNKVELAKRVVAIGTDGAAVLVGEHSGMVRRLQNSFPFLLGFHCFAHRVDLAAQAITKSSVVEDIISSCNRVTKHYAHGGKRDDELFQCQSELGMRKLKLIRPAETRWMSYKLVIEKVHKNLPALMMHLRAEREEGLYGCIANVRSQLGMSAMLPAMDALNSLIVSLQTDSGYIRDFVHEVESTIQKLRLLYLDEDDAWVGESFAHWKELKSCLSPMEKKRAVSPWVFSTGPDIDDAEYDEPVLFYKIGQDLHLLLAKHVPTDKCPRPPRYAAPVPELQLRMIVSDVKDQITSAISALVEDLEDRFPCRDLLYAFEIISPQYWYDGVVPDDFEAMLDRIAAEFGVDKFTSAEEQVTALIDGDKLHEQASQFQSLAIHFSARVLNGGVPSETVSTRADKLALFWQAISNSTQSSELVGEFLRLASLLITVVSGSVADERVFSALEFVKNNRRARLKDAHLMQCVRLQSQNLFTVENFPYRKALLEWYDGASVRGRYMAS